jgi:small subunit ribosomal protein S6
LVHDPPWAEGNPEERRHQQPIMRTYELTYIVRGDVSGEALQDVKTQVQGWIESQGNTVVNVDEWGRRRLAYPINDQREGHYFTVETEAEPETLREIERNLKLNESILRYLLVRVER